MEGSPQILTRSRMLGSLSDWSRELRERTSLKQTSPEARQALDAVDSAISGMHAGGDTVDLKKQTREELWNFRRSYGQEAPLEIRRGYEKLRNLSLDNTVERMARGAEIPTSHFVTRPQPCDIPNFAVVNDTFLRGGQPDQDGINWLFEHGIKSRVDLRGDDRNNQWNPPVWNPLQTYEINVHDFGTPTFDMVERFIDIVDDPKNQPVFVHCKAGIGRTGLMTACWNVAHGMPVENALAQEKINSYHGNLRQEDFVRDFGRYWREKHSASVISS